MNPIFSILLFIAQSGNICDDTYAACEDFMRDNDFNALINERCEITITEGRTLAIDCPRGTRKSASYTNQDVHRVCEDPRELCSANRTPWLSCMAGPGDRGWCRGVRDGYERCSQTAPPNCYYLDMTPKDGHITLWDYAEWRIRLQERMDANARLGD
jgi:hypothetical protein